MPLIDRIHLLKASNTQDLPLVHVLIQELKMVLMNILVIDDDEQFLFVLGELLKKYGFNVSLARNGMEALETISEEDIHLIITDTIMPDTPIMSFICTLKNSYPELPVILISGLPTSPLINNSLILGADQFLPKPLDLNSLFTAINKFKAA